MDSPRPGVRAGSPAAKTRARIARAHRFGAPAAAITDLERQLRHDMAADYIRELVAGWPKLTDEQLADLRALLTTGAR